MIEALESLTNPGRKPKGLQFDKGSEFRSRRMLKWCRDSDVLLRFIPPGNPTHNGYIESLKGTFREECINDTLVLESQRRKA